MTEDKLPATIPALEAKIAELEKKLATGEGLESRLIAKLESEIKRLEAKLAEKKAEDPPPADPRRGGLSDHFIL